MQWEVSFLDHIVPYSFQTSTGFRLIPVSVLSPIMESQRKGCRIQLACRGVETGRARMYTGPHCFAYNGTSALLSHFFAE